MIVGVKQHDILTYRIAICSIVLGAIFDKKLDPSLRTGQFERMRRVDDENELFSFNITLVKS